MLYEPIRSGHNPQTQNAMSVQEEPEQSRFIYPRGQYDVRSREWHGRTGDRKILHRNFGCHVLHMLLQRDNDAIVQLNDETGRTMTALEMRQKSLKIAEQVVKRMQLVPDDTVTLVTEQHDELAPLVIGLLIAGMVVNPLSPDCQPCECRGGECVCVPNNLTDLLSCPPQLSSSVFWRLSNRNWSSVRLRW